METQTANKRVIAKNTAFLFAGQILTWALTMVFTFYVPRRVGTTEWGALTSATAITTMASTVFALGIGTVMVRDMARDFTKAPAMIGTAIAARLVLSIPCLLLIVVVVQLGHYSVLTQQVIYVLAIGMLLQLLTGPFQAGFQAAERMHYNSLSDVISKGIVSFVSVAVILAGFDIVGVVVVSASAALIVLGLNLYWWRRVGKVSYRLDLKLMRYLVVGGLPFFATGIFLTIYLYVDSVMLSFMAPLPVVGLYGAPTKLFTTLLFLPVIFSTALFPALTRAYKVNPSEMVSLARKSFNLLTALSLPVAVGGMLLASQIIFLLYGKQYAPSAPIMVVLAATLVPTYLNILVNQFLVATDRQIAWTKVMAAACVLNPLLNYFLIGYFQRTTGNGGFGAAIALLTTEMLMTVAGVLLLPRGVLGATNVVTMLKSGLAAGIMGVGVFYTRTSFILLPIALGTALYFVSAFLLRVLPKEDFAMVSVFWYKAAAKLKLNRFARPKAAPGVLGWRELFTADLLHWQRIGFGARVNGNDRIGFAEAAKLWWNYPGVRATLIYRLGYAAHVRHVRLVPGIMYRRNIRKYGLDIVPSVPIGPGLYIPHPVSTVVMARKIGENVSLISGITIGMRNRHDFPTIGDNVTIGAGARLLGGITIGDNALIGANAVVTKDVPANSTAIGIPARILTQHSSQTANEALRGIPDAAAAGSSTRFARTSLRADDSSEMLAIRLHSANGHSNGNGNGNGNGVYVSRRLPESELDDLDELEDGDGARAELVTSGERPAFTIIRRPAAGS